MKNSLPMKMVRMLLLGLCGVLLLVACGENENETPPPVPPTNTPDTPQIRVTVAEAPVFAEPSTTAEVIINLFEGDRRRIVGQSPPDIVGLVYYQIDLGNRTGWIAETQVETQGNLEIVNSIDPTAIAATVLAQEPTATPQLPTPSPSPTFQPSATSSIPLARVDVSRALVFDTPSRAANTLVTLFEGEQFRAVSVSQPNALGDVFYEVELGSQTGWVLSSQVEIIGDVGQLAVIDPSEFTTPTEVSDSVSTDPTASSTSDSSPTLAPLSATRDPDVSTVTPSATLPATSDAPFAIREFEPPPLTIDVPASWEAIHVLVPVANGIAAGNVAMSVYEGPLPDEMQGTIWIIWGFPNIVNPLGEFDLWADGLQLLRGLMFNQCNIGIDTKREYDVGNQTGVGTIYSAVDCPEGDDIAGYFTALQVEGGNYAFFTGVQPVGRASEGTVYLQEILDTVQFQDLEN